ncbi:hypothetical protein LWI29_034802 [Acer saccharum]|uniref:RNase H type-1 domain-containing protein n=1 Tax=Acer saccharum TaxID=4024 RepID=A0AA39VEN0_ACESA|nr:hypothetical protein LWI29_034802 [Acer saccharum]
MTSHAPASGKKETPVTNEKRRSRLPSSETILRSGPPTACLHYLLADCALSEGSPRLGKFEGRHRLATNNEAEYEALLAGLTVARELGARFLAIKSDSQLIVKQVAVTYQAKGNNMFAYLEKVQQAIKAFQMLQKRILSFSQIVDHKGDLIGKCIENVLIEWGIDKVFTITVDNETSNTTAIGYVIRKLNSWQDDGTVLEGKFYGSSGRGAKETDDMFSIGVGGGASDDLELGRLKATDKEDSLWGMKQQEQDITKGKSEVDLYLLERAEKLNERFDVLAWWKNSIVKFLILSMVTRDVFAMPISTVASESAFSTGGHILDPFRSSLTSKIVNGLILTGN